jgi:hypothetical protein
MTGKAPALLIYNSEKWPGQLLLCDLIEEGQLLTLHGGDIGALDIVLELGDLFLQVVQGDLFVLYELCQPTVLDEKRESIPMTRLIWSFLIPKPTATSWEAPQSKPSCSIERTDFSRAAMSVSSSQGFTSRVTTD